VQANRNIGLHFSCYRLPVLWYAKRNALDSRILPGRNAESSESRKAEGNCDCECPASKKNAGRSRNPHCNCSS